MSGRLQGPAAWLLGALTAIVMIFILAPLLVTVATSVSNTEYIVFPPHGFTLQWYGKALQDEDFRTAMGFSTVLALAATTGALLLGVPAAFALARSQFPGRDTIGSILLSPLIFPVLITVGLGVAFRSAPGEVLTGAATDPAIARALRAAPSLDVIELGAEEAAARLATGAVALVVERAADAGDPPVGDLALLEPVEEAWAVGTIGVGYDEASGRVVVVLTGVVEDESEEAPSARFALTRAQASAFVDRAQDLMRGGRPICPLCSGAIDPGGHACPRSNGHVVSKA